MTREEMFELRNTQNVDRDLLLDIIKNYFYIKASYGEFTVCNFFGKDITVKKASEECNVYDELFIDIVFGNFKKGDDTKHGLIVEVLKRDNLPLYKIRKKFNQYEPMTYINGVLQDEFIYESPIKINHWYKACDFCNFFDRNSQKYKEFCKEENERIHNLLIKNGYTESMKTEKVKTELEKLKE